MIESDSDAVAIVVFDIDGVVRDVGGSYRRAIADTVEHFTATAYRPTSLDIDTLKSEGIWNNDWEASQELIYRYFEGQGQPREQINLNYNTLVDFFQSRYRGPDPNTMTGYICQEPLLMPNAYLASLTSAGIAWGFFSGAMRAEATYILEGALGLSAPVLVAMEDAPGKPDPTGLFAAVAQLEERHQSPELTPVIYVGDTVADIYAVGKAKEQQPQRCWLGVGVLPPHIQQAPLERRQAYRDNLNQAGAVAVLDGVQELTPALIGELIIDN